MTVPQNVLNDPDCIFCKIVAGRIPCHKIHEDDAIVSFLDSGPLVSGHALVIPKSHYQNVFDVPPELFARISAQLPALARAVTAAVEAPACHILLNNGPQAMQSVLHLHYHIIPRKNGDRFFIPWRPGSLDTATARQLVCEIKNRLGGTQEPGRI